MDTNAAVPKALAKRPLRGRQTLSVESLHIADAGCWPDPLEAAVQKLEKQTQKQDERAAERARREVEEVAEHGRRVADAAVEAERRAAEEAVAEKAARVVAALEEADVQRAREETDAAARQAAKKKAKQDAHAAQLVNLRWRGALAWRSSHSG